MLLLLLLVWAGSSRADEYAAKQRELAEIKEAQSRAQALLADLAKTESAIMAELRELDQELARAKQELARVEQARQRTSASLAEIEKEVKTATQRYEESQAKLAEIMVGYNRRLRQLYMSSGTDLLDLLLVPGAVDDWVMRLRLFSALLEQDVELYQRVSAQKAATEAERARLNWERTRLQQERTRLTQLERQAQQQVDQVAKRRAERDQKLQEILKEKSGQEQAIKELAANSQRIQAWLEANKPPPPPTPKPTPGTAEPRVKFARPVAAPITANFGWRLDPLDNVNRFHEGVDFGAPEGTPIKAAGEGRVVLAGWVGGYGYTIIIEHANGYSTLYAHASRLLAEVGQWVNTGQIIAEVGNSGVSTAPHLHFEVRRGGQPVNPLEYLSE